MGRLNVRFYSNYLSSHPLHSPLLAFQSMIDLHEPAFEFSEEVHATRSSTLLILRKPKHEWASSFGHEIYSEVIFVEFPKNNTVLVLKLFLPSHIVLYQTKDESRSWTKETIICWCWERARSINWTTSKYDFTSRLEEDEHRLRNANKYLSISEAFENARSFEGVFALLLKHCSPSYRRWRRSTPYLPNSVPNDWCYLLIWVKLGCTDHENNESR